MFKNELRYYLVMLTAEKMLEEEMMTPAEFKLLKKKMQKKYDPFMQINVNKQH